MPQIMNLMTYHFNMDVFKLKNSGIILAYKDIVGKVHWMEEYNGLVSDLKDTSLILYSEGEISLKKLKLKINEVKKRGKGMFTEGDSESINSGKRDSRT